MRNLPTYDDFVSEGRNRGTREDRYKVLRMLVDDYDMRQTEGQSACEKRWSTSKWWVSVNLPAGAYDLELVVGTDEGGSRDMYFQEYAVGSIKAILDPVFKEMPVTKPHAEHAQWLLANGFKKH